VEEDAKDVASRAGVKLRCAIGYRITKKPLVIQENNINYPFLLLLNCFLMDG
jgi:hypothetical protein